MNILSTREFVINILSKERLDQVLRCATPYQEGVNKLELAGLRWYSSKMVKPPRVREAKAWIECRVLEEKRLGDHVVIFGEVVTAEVRDDATVGEEIDLSKVNPVGHIGKDKFAVDFKVIKHKRYDK
jgi:flavin reductase (DIM6/NTAB) family NADH-FMN oxidoreductase RutF